MESSPREEDQDRTGRAAKRNKEFRRHEPHHSALRIDNKHTTGPLSFLNPTSARFDTTSNLTKPQSPSSPRQHATTEADGSTSAVAFKWTSRNNRKGRHALAINPAAPTTKAPYETPRATNSLKEIGRGIIRMITVYPVWDISYDVAVIFTLGSVVWVFNAFFVWLPLVRPSTEFSTEVLYGGGITAFIGATIFEFGSVLLVAEAVNENRTECFGWALEHATSHEVEKGTGTARLRPSNSGCTHHHRNKRNLVGKGQNVVKDGYTVDAPSGKRSWTWFPSVTELRTHYIHELGFLASVTQLIAATIFWIAGFTSLPGIYDHMSSTITIVFYWNPQTIGGTGFIISGALFMLETQSRWYKPAFSTLGWWIGAWNLIGGVGFTLCPAFGYDQNSWAQYQACLSTFWGSWAFLIGSVIQWYESLQKHPVEVDKS
ncbi:integral membrane protein [Lophiostoma macrostomum CBS 122681]|uniref:Integral membrane protein n=1 Tax=Lophiostoma macrostomum CBS 122681 TaxID=1314788 RepID=A0A6A6TMW6_9PLEO|nr:integral membrane protein [Lophiostoma macrostomum CBS 122681]